MHPDKRRRGRRIRRQRRAIRRVGEQFGHIGKAAGVAAIAFGSFASALRAAVAHEEELARRTAEGAGQPTNHENRRQS